MKNVLMLVLIIAYSWWAIKLDIKPIQPQQHMRKRVGVKMYETADGMIYGPLYGLRVAQDMGYNRDVDYYVDTVIKDSNARTGFQVFGTGFDSLAAKRKTPPRKVRLH